MKKNISFYIAKNRADKRGFVPIYAQVTINSKNYPVQIEKVKPRYWNKSKQRVNKNRQDEPYNRHTEINAYLEKLSTDTDRFDRFINYNEPPGRDEVKEALFSISPDKKTFNSAYTEFIESNRNKVIYNTTKGRVTAKRFIDKFQQNYSTVLHFDDINIQLYNKLYDYAFDELDLENNAFCTYIVKFKAFLNWANEMGYYNRLDHKKFKCTEKEKPIITLTEDELTTLYYYKFKNKSLDKARDWFCFGCFTGLRYSDIKDLKYEHIGEEFIVKTMVKTKTEVKIPILPQAQEIIDKYRTGFYLPLPKLSNQKLNDYIKECCEMAGIDTPIERITYKGNQRNTDVLPKYKLITAHVGRKTFISFCLNKGVDRDTVRSITGHQKDANFIRYVKIEDDAKKKKVLNVWKDF